MTTAPPSEGLFLEVCMFQRFPLCMYLRGDVLSDYVIVYDEEQAAAKRQDGFAEAGEPQEKAPDEPAEPAKRKPGRPRKVA